MIYICTIFTAHSFNVDEVISQGNVIILWDQQIGVIGVFY